MEEEIKPTEEVIIPVETVEEKPEEKVEEVAEPEVVL